MLINWQVSIENEVKKMLRRHYGGLAQLDAYAKPDQIGSDLRRFYAGINQMMIAQLYEKFLQELEQLLKWLLRFAKRVPNF